MLRADGTIPDFLTKCYIGLHPRNPMSKGLLLASREQTHSSYDNQEDQGKLGRGNIRAADVVNLFPAVLSSCIVILESNPIRAMDALHVACALEWRAELFVSSDKRQITAAKKAGLRTNLV